MLVPMEAAYSWNPKWESDHETDSLKTRSSVPMYRGRRSLMPYVGSLGRKAKMDSNESPNPNDVNRQIRVWD